MSLGGFRAREVALLISAGGTVLSSVFRARRLRERLAAVAQERHLLPQEATR